MVLHRDTVVKVAVPVLILSLGVETGEQIGNLDFLGASRYAVAAPGARDGVETPKNAPHLLNGVAFRLG